MNSDKVNEKLQNAQTGFTATTCSLPDKSTLDAQSEIRHTLCHKEQSKETAKSYHTPHHGKYICRTQQLQKKIQLSEHQYWLEYPPARFK